MPKKPAPINLWFRRVGGPSKGRTKCPTCAARIDPGCHVFSWVNYVNSRARMVDRFCRRCWVVTVIGRLKSRGASLAPGEPGTLAGRPLEIQTPYGGRPWWMVFPGENWTFSAPDGARVTFPSGETYLSVMADWCEDHDHEAAPALREMAAV